MLTTQTPPHPIPAPNPTFDSDSTLYLPNDFTFLELTICKSECICYTCLLYVELNEHEINQLNPLQ